MQRTYILLAAGLTFQAASFAQTPPTITSFQQAQSLGQPKRAVAIASRAEIGKPFSATVTTRTNQTYLDGTHVNRTTVTVQYRDAYGRTRLETGGTSASSSELVQNIVIRDPVAGVTYRLDPVRKTAVKIVMAGIPTGAQRGGGVPSLSIDVAAAAARSNPNSIVEDLGTNTVNGIPARGTRITNVIPVGAIGNDREIRSVDERWFSPDLNLLIKSVSTDPRFGTTTHEYTNISRQPPDQSLFEVPGDYKMVSNESQF